MRPGLPMRTVPFPRRDKGLHVPVAYNRPLRPRIEPGSAMEAEQLNQIANKLAGLKERAGAMRRYL
jgi:hypothetical protein